MLPNHQITPKMRERLSNQARQGKTLCWGSPRRRHKRPPIKKALTATASDGSVGFLTLKKSINQVIDTRLKKIEGARGVMKTVKKIQTKVDAKEVDTDDLPTSSVEILKNAKQVMKELKEAKKNREEARTHDEESKYNAKAKGHQSRLSGNQN